MDVTSLLNTGAAAASTADATSQPPSTALEQLAHKREDSSDGGLAASVSEGLVPSSSMTALSTQGTSSRRPSLSREPSQRNRTPWDAGGFSLSLYSPARDDRSTAPMDTAGGATTTGAPALALPASSPSASRSRPSMHRFSDSRSSFSSAYTNSSSSASSTTNDSVSHSRISSLSTVSENPPLSSRMAEVSLMEVPIVKEAAPAISYPHHQQPQQPQGEEKPRSPSREQSPSDAILIPRATSQDDEGSDLLSANMRLHLHPLHAHNHTSVHGASSRLPGSPSRRHKRAVSAPDFPSINDSCFPTFGPIPEPTPSPSEHSDGTAMDDNDALSSPDRSVRHRLPPTDEADSPESGSGSGSGSGYNSDLPMQSAYASSSPQRLGTSPMKSETGAHAYYRGTHSATSEHPGSHLYSPPTNRANGPLAIADLPENFEVASACMYRGDCQTGSQLRKAISHIFGRNKLCTRMIPAGVWVHYCRKHYQRTRYRNGGEYPQRQIALVQEQIRRVQAWSDANTQQGRTPVLKDWSLSVRKREQLRLDTKMAVLGKKRRYRNEDDDQDDMLGDDRAELNGTAVPDWVVEHLGDGYSTAEIMAVVDHLKSDIDEGRLQQIPDIEILPNIVSDLANHIARGITPKKPYARRRAGSGVAGGGGGLGIGGHRRSQSVNMAGLRSDAVPMARRRSQPSSNNFSPAPPVGYFSTRAPYVNEQPQTPLEKRQRVDSEGTQGEGERPQSYGGRMQLAHRPAFAGIRESHAEGTDYRYMYADGHSSGMQGYGGAIDGYYPPPPPQPATTAREQVPLPPSYEHNYNMHDYEERRDYYERRLNSASGPNGGANGYGILPAPLPRRYSRPSVAQLEESSYAMNPTAQRRSGAHQRSQSEAGFFHAPPMGVRYPQSGPDMPGPLSFAGPTQEQDHEPLVPGGLPGRPSHVAVRHGSPYDDEWRSGAINNQPPPHAIAYADADVHGSYRYDNVQLPPLQSIQPSSSLGNGPDLLSRRDFAGPSKHMRHQSSPAVTRMHPANMEVPGRSPATANAADN